MARTLEMTRTLRRGSGRAVTLRAHTRYEASTIPRGPRRKQNCEAQPGTLSAELEDFLKSRIAGEASDAAPRRHGGLLLGLLANDDDDDIFDEEVEVVIDFGETRVRSKEKFRRFQIKAYFLPLPKAYHPHISG